MGKRSTYKVHYASAPHDVSYYEVKKKRRGLNLYYIHNTVSFGGEGECVAKIREDVENLAVTIKLGDVEYILPLHQVEELCVLLSLWQDSQGDMMYISGDA